MIVSKRDGVRSVAAVSGRRRVACYDELKATGLVLLCADGSMTKAPLAREVVVLQPDGSGQAGRQTQSLDRGSTALERGGGRG